MNQKKCPKCGENNPVEGVMCWACYTPLSGGTGVGAKANGPGNINAPPLIDEPQKAKITPVQMGVLGVGLLVALFVGWQSISGGSPPSDLELPIPPSPTESNAPNVIEPSQPVSGNPPPPPAPAPNPGAGNDPLTYAITTPPNAKTRWATMGIVPSTNVDKRVAASLASQARQRVGRTVRWDGIFVYAFANRQAADTFQQYQSDRNGAPLEASDYLALKEVWVNTQARYEYNSNGTEAVRYPQDDPGNWYRGKSKWSRAR